MNDIHGAGRLGKSNCSAQLSKRPGCRPPVQVRDELRRHDEPGKGLLGCRIAAKAGIQFRGMAMHRMC